MLPKDSVLVHTDQIDLAFTLSDLPGHVVPFLQQFNHVWWGRCRSDVFHTRFQYLKNHTVNALFTADPDQDDWHMLKSLGNKMDMCHRPVTETYRWPIMAVVESVDTIIWNNGENRLLAAGVRWDRPCDNFNLVVLANNENQARAILDQPREIESDDDLISLLGVQDRCRIQTRLHWKNGRYAFSIDDIGATETFKHTREDSVEWVRRFVAWRQKYGSNPRLRVYCKDPSQIRNGTQHWSVEWAGPNTQSIQDVFNQQQDPDLHTLIIASGQEIFIDDLFLWVNLDHSVWQDHQNRCTLMRKYFAWSACKITVSSHATQ